MKKAINKKADQIKKAINKEKAKKLKKAKT